MDYAKLTHLNGLWLRAADDARLTDDVVARLPAQCGVSADEAGAARILALMPGLKERAKTLVELTAAAAFLIRSVPLECEPKAASLLTPAARAMLQRLALRLVETNFEGPELDAALRAFAAAEGLKLGEVAQPLRAALTGSTMSPGIDATLAALGKAESLARMRAVAA